MARDLLRDDNGVIVEAGQTVIWVDFTGRNSGEVKYDLNYTDNLRIGTNSVRTIYDESDSFVVV